MSKEFGVRFLKENIVDEETSCYWPIIHQSNIFTDNSVELIIVDRHKIKFYVAKESEEIFIPKHDDLGLTKKDLLPCVFNFKNNWMGISTVGDYGIKEDEECSITMREDKPFLDGELENE